MEVLKVIDNGFVKSSRNGLLMHPIYELAGGREGGGGKGRGKGGEGGERGGGKERKKEKI